MLSPEGATRLSADEDRVAPSGLFSLLYPLPGAMPQAGIFLPLWGAKNQYLFLGCFSASNWMLGLFAIVLAIPPRLRALRERNGCWLFFGSGAAGMYHYSRNSSDGPKKNSPLAEDAETRRRRENHGVGMFLCEQLDVGIICHCLGYSSAPPRLCVLSVLRENGCWLFLRVAVSPCHRVHRENDCWLLFWFRLGWTAGTTG